MIDAVVLCPHPPLLLRELCGARDAVPDLRRACGEALERSLGPSVEAVVVLGGADEAGEWEPSLPVDTSSFGSFGSFGTTRAPAGPALPPSLGVGRRLLEQARWTGPVVLRTVACDASREEVAREAGTLVAVTQERVTVLLVLADGSPRRGEKAPGHLDERAFAFDAGIVEALATADAKALAGLDPTTAAELMVLGRAPYAVLGELALAEPQRSWTGEVLHDDDPYGVQYTVASWRAVPVPPVETSGRAFDDAP